MGWIISLPQHDAGFSVSKIRDQAPTVLGEPRTVAPGVDSYKSTACRRNSLESFLRAMVEDNLGLSHNAGFSVSKNQGQGPAPFVAVRGPDNSSSIGPCRLHGRASRTAVDAGCRPSPAGVR